MGTARDRIAELDYVLTGTITKKYGPCGKQQCRCKHDRRYWHGPYYIWTRKEGGKTVTRSLSPQQAKMCSKAIANTRKLETLVLRWRRESAKALVKV